jgi:quinol-cytochrome oxidoreductase complex cytochrome b subunit
MLEYVPFVGNWIQQVFRGGSEVGSATLSNFYSLHIALLPLAVCFMMAFHFWRVRKAGGVAVPAPEGSERQPMIPTVPHLVVREAAVGLVLIATILLVSVFFDAPLEAPANAGMSPNPAKAPWFFVGVQEVFLHVHPFFAVVVFPGMLIGALVLLPYFMDGKESRPGIWFQTDRGRRMCAAAGGVSVLVVILGVLADELMQESAAVGAARSSWLMGGLVPAVVVLGFAWGVYVFTKKKYGATHGEAMQALFTFFLAAVVVLTVIGIWFRGEFMALCWPWENGVL